MSKRSRLAIKTAKKTRKNIFLTLLGSILIIIIIVKFGIEILVNFSLFIEKFKNQTTTSQKNESAFISTPILNPLANATNSAQIIISGKSDPETTVNLYINGRLKDSLETKKDGSFSFNETLSSGNNSIKLNAEKDNKKSSFSSDQNIVFKNTKPSLEISSPQDGQSFSKDQNTANILGKTDSGVSITVNGLWAVVDENNNFSYTLPLKNGDNEVKITATDQAGNKTEKTIKISYSQ